MCGISGFFDINEINQYQNEFLRMNEVVNHRGPDGFGYAYFRRDYSDMKLINSSVNQESTPHDKAILALGHRRLSIIDLTVHASQPMSASDNQLWITYNGEIYNYIELREELSQLGYIFSTHSDTEVILNSYAEWGVDCVNHFNGIWALAIADLKQARLFCSRDRFGVKPFHYFWDGKRFIFASEIKQLFCYPFVSRKINDKAVYDYLTFGAVDCSEETFFASVSKLMQGYNLILDLKDCSIKKYQYYSPELTKNYEISYLDASQEFHRLFADSIRIQLRSDVEVGSCLSGGLDSSSIVCVINDQLSDNKNTNLQHTFSSHFDEKEANELEYMNEVIGQKKITASFIYPTPADLLNDLEKIIWHQDEPFGSTSIYAQWSVFKLIHDCNVKVVLDGQGADEMLAGYVGLYPSYFDQLWDKRQYGTFFFETNRYARLHGQPWLRLIKINPWKILKKIKPNVQSNGFRHSVNWLNPSLKDTYEMQSAYLETRRKVPFGDKEHLENNLYQMTFLNNLQALLRHEDRNSMAFSIEARVPFLDHRLVEFAFSLPSKFKIRGGYTKRILRDGMKDIIPEKIRWRVKKLGFATPEKKWQQTILKPLINKAVNNERIKPYITASDATNYLRELEQYSVTDFAPWRWLNLSLWMDRYDLG